ncbi:MAG: TlpA family protein disulfide reductase [Vulcanimicrobiaceae bacterium]
MNRRLFLVWTAFAAGLLAVTLDRPVSAPAAAPLRIGQPAPNFSAPRVGGGALTLAALHGKPVYLNFFASWCAPCQAETASIVGLDEKFSKKGLVVIGVDELENAKTARGFIGKYKIPYEVVTDEGPVGHAYGLLGLPLHVFIDRNGNVKLFRFGEMQPAEIEAAIKSIL